MNLEQTIKQMREKNKDDAKFYPLIESMKRRAAKGLLEGVKPEDIDFVVNTLKEDNNSNSRKPYSNLSLNQELFELNEAISDYENLDNYSEEEVEQMIYEGFIGELNKYLLNEDDEGTAGRVGRAIGTGVGAGIGAGAAYGTYKLGTQRGWWPKISDKVKYAQTLGRDAGAKIGATTLTPGKGFSSFGSQGFGGMKAGFDAGKLAATSNGANGLIGGISGAASAAPIATAATAIGGGLLLGAGIYGAVKLIKWLRKKRQERQRSSFELQEFLFNPEFDSSFAYIVNNLTEEEIQVLKENACEDTIEIINMFRGRGETLNESVTFIDNAGNLKTMLTPDYVKDMHEYNTDTEIAKYKKKKKIIDYKLLSEEIDINSIKPLSEMSLEEILNEDLL